MFAVPFEHRHEHLVTTLCALHQHRGGDRHEHPEEALAAHAFADVGEAQRGVGSQGLVVDPQQLVVVVAAALNGQRAAEEVRRIRHGRTPRDGLPVDDGQRPVRGCLSEQHVVEAVVTVDQSLRMRGRRLLGHVGVERRDEAFAHLAVGGRDLVPVSVAEPRVKRGEQALVHH